MTSEWIGWRRARDLALASCVLWLAFENLLLIGLLPVLHHGGWSPATILTHAARVAATWVIVQASTGGGLS